MDDRYQRDEQSENAFVRKLDILRSAAGARFDEIEPYLLAQASGFY